jgi:tetratricopeptide (TPR) repeat protein
MSADAGALDYLQFPYQTLVYRGGDCDDLSVMFAAVLESVGIKTAFITIPGHIYMAFDLNMDEDAARRTFLNSDELIFIEGRAWVPVEVTLLNEGFTRAWLVGARQWQDNFANGTAEFFALEGAWNEYEPVGIPGEDTRIVLPEADHIVGAYLQSLAHFVEREVRPQAEKLEAEIRVSGNNPRLLNRLGVLYARFGIYDDARKQFELAIRSEYLPALVNLGNVSYLQGRYEEALTYYGRALERSPNNKQALLGVARAQYELENYSEAGNAYEVVRDIDPDLAAGYAYLASASSNEGLARASAAAALRTGGAAWLED